MLAHIAFDTPSNAWMNFSEKNRSTFHEPCRRSMKIMRFG